MMSLARWTYFAVFLVVLSPALFFFIFNPALAVLAPLISLLLIRAQCTLRYPHRIPFILTTTWNAAHLICSHLAGTERNL